MDPADGLIADILPRREKRPFPLRTREPGESLSFAEAARWLVFLQAYNLFGTKSAVVGNTRAKAGKVFAPKESVGTGRLGAIGGVF